jgi:hypothetical protein
MFRKSIVALATVAALITLTVTEVSARGGGGHGGGGFRGGGFHGGGFSRGMGGGPRMHMGGGGYRGGWNRGFVNRGFVGRGYVNRGFGPRWGHRAFVRRPFFGPRFRFYGYPYAYYGGVADSCFRWRRVWTPVGWRFRRFWVCGYQYW